MKRGVERDAESSARNGKNTSTTSEVVAKKDASNARNGKNASTTSEAAAEKVASNALNVGSASMTSAAAAERKVSARKEGIEQNVTSIGTGDGRYQDRRYGDQSSERSFQDRRYGARAERYEGQGQLHISRRQRARVHDILVRRRVEPESIDFPVRIGARVPSYITSYRIPDEVYEYLPGYERYRYFVTGDDVVIVDPATLEVVAVLED